MYATGCCTRFTSATEHFDVIQAESIEMAAYLPEQAAHSARNAGSTLILDQFNAEYLIQKRAFWADARTPRRWRYAAAYSASAMAQIASLRGSGDAALQRGAGCI